MKILLQSLHETLKIIWTMYMIKNILSNFKIFFFVKYLFLLY
jgi:hypothetical protein